ncbi:MAG: hypothetical protein K2X72_35765 [Reyranella sp.]|nr:hypothetical protein [Reyranella sp.]
MQIDDQHAAYVDLEPRSGDNHVPGKMRQRLSEGADARQSFSPENCMLLEA